MNIILVAALFTLVTQAGRFEVGEPGPMHRPCDTAAAGACETREHVAEQECQYRTNMYQAQENTVNADLASRRENLAATNVAVANIAAQLQTAREELRFLDDLEEKSPPAAEIFAGSPSLEKIFSVDQLSRSWDERYPQQYRLKLKDQESSLAISSQKFARQQGEIESEISSMLPTQAFLSGEKNRWLNDVNIHVHMWQRGCREQVCPNNF